MNPPLPHDSAEMSQPLRVLIVEDSEDDMVLLLRQLRHGGYAPTWQRVDTATAMAAALDQHAWDIVIADHHLPTFSAPHALRLLQQKNLDLPFIIVSGTIGEDVAVAAMKAGAHDYLIKGKLARLVPAVERELREAQERQQRRNAEQALRENQERFRSLIENALDIITVLEEDGSIRYESASVERVLGYAPAALIGKKMLDYVHPKEVAQVAGMLTRVKQHRDTACSVEFRFQHRQGAWRILEAIGKYFLDASGKGSVVINARDITERKQAEDMRQQLEREKELRELKIRFFSMMSHELQNPLTAIMGATELLEDYSHKFSDEKRSQLFQTIRSSIKQITHLLNDTLVIGKAESGRFEFRPEPLELASFCSELIDQMRLSPGGQPTIHWIGDGHPFPAAMDAELLRHILGNLLSNAVKYSPPGRAVHFELRRGALAQPDPEEAAIFRIQDQGIGIPPEDQQQLFDSFHRARNVGRIPGTGLGLAIVKQCVDLHGGSIALESQVGVGTTFTVTLPLRSCPA